MTKKHQVEAQWIIAPGTQNSIVLSFGLYIYIFFSAVNLTIHTFKLFIINNLK